MNGHEMDFVSNVLTQLQASLLSRVVPLPELCIPYATGCCPNPSTCRRFHLCHQFVRNKCGRTERCRFAHQLSGDPHNAQLTQWLPPFSHQLLVEALASAVQSLVICPVVCSAYNGRHGCTDGRCFQLHCCSSYVTGGVCQDSLCSLFHSLTGKHNEKVLSHYGMDAAEVREAIGNRRRRNRSSGDGEVETMLNALSLKNGAGDGLEEDSEDEGDYSGEVVVNNIPSGRRRKGRNIRRDKHVTGSQLNDPNLTNLDKTLVVASNITIHK